MKVISLGWGVQSFGLAAMSALGVLPRVDAAIHADTTHERSETYAFARKWTPWLEERGVRVVTVVDPVSSAGLARAPYFTLKANGEMGRLKRSCTQRWKIAPIERWLRQHRNGRPVEQWIGITVDEAERATISRRKTIQLAYPFLDLRWRRMDVVRWLRENRLEIPVKSGCVFCPFHSRSTWREIKNGGNGDWTKALATDTTIRHASARDVEWYLVRECKPLAECDFSSPEDHGQMTLWEAEECSGMCFL